MRLPSLTERNPDKIPKVIEEFTININPVDLEVPLTEKEKGDLEKIKGKILCFMQEEDETENAPKE